MKKNGMCAFTLGIIFAIGLIATTFTICLIYWKIAGKQRSSDYDRPLVSSKLRSSISQNGNFEYVRITVPLRQKNRIQSKVSLSIENDNFCDDLIAGLDESKTSACSFYTARSKKFNCGDIYIFSSRVNDHVCDCNNGADEPALGILYCQKYLNTISKFFSKSDRDKNGKFLRWPNY